MRRSAVFAAAVLVLLASPTLAQTTHEDPLGRFALDLPSGWKLVSQQLDMVYQFERGGAKIILYVMDGVADRAKAFRDAVGMFTGEMPPPPPPDTPVYDLVTNGNGARQMQYTFQAAAGNKQVPLTLFLGTITLEGANMSVSFMAMLNEQGRKQWEGPVAQSFRSIRMRGSSVTGASEPVLVANPFVAESDAPASTFEHALVTLDIPVGWSATAGEGPNIVTIEHREFAAVRVIGLPKNEFGKSRDEVMTGVVGGLQAALPVFNQTREPREETTAGGIAVQLAEYQGTLMVQGREIPQWVLVGAFKDQRGGVGFLWMTPPEKKDAALEQVLGMIRSAR